MGFEVKLTHDGRFDWTVWNSAYGLVCGTADTLDEAKVEMAIGQADMFESPFPPKVVAAMRADYAAFAVDYPDPAVTTWEAQK